MKKILIILFILFLNFFQAQTLANEERTFLTGKIESADFLKNANDYVVAIIKGDEKKVEQYLKLGANPNEKYSNLPVIFFASHLKYENIVELLLKYGADPNSSAFGENILKYSIYRKCTPCVSSIINYGADINSKKFLQTSALDFALQRQEKEIASLLLRAGAKTSKKSLKLMRKLEY
ncbi:MAG: ankyrin repeat domain-containing protein [Cyanobacteria bacterium SIG30]|nr:ankyrin repeat domain-containing protein [Cyanobacteria bacterium SIG30]